MNTKSKSYNGKIKTDFLIKKSQKKDSDRIWLAAIVLNFVWKIKNKDDKDYPQISLEECEYEEKKAKKKNRDIKEKIITIDNNESGESDDETIK